VQMGYNMQMVFNAVDPIKMAIFVFQDTPDIFVQFFTVFFEEYWFSVFGAEDNLI
jgi:hypothetical protein